MHEELTRMIQNTSVSIADHKITPKKALMHETFSLHKDNAYSKPNGVVIVSEHHNKILCQSSEMLAFKSMQRMHFLKAFPFLQNPILRNIQTTNISNTVQKVVSNIFGINLKIN